MNFYFSAKGRVSRKDYWLRFVLPLLGLYLVVVLVVFGLMSALGEAGAIVGLLVIPIYIAIVWASVCVAAKRFHDRGWSGWWVLWFMLIGIGIAIVQYGLMFAFGTDSALAGIVALVGALASLVIAIWQLVLLGFLPGDKGPNQYGPDPLDPNGGTADTFS